MRNFRIVFYKSEGGELVKMKEFVKQAERLNDLITDPPEEFFEMLEGHSPVHGWAELETGANNVFVIFSKRNRKLPDSDDEEFRNWLAVVRPSDFE